MTKPDLMAELAAVVRLSERATPGPWKEWRDGAADYAKVEACPDGPNIANTGRLGWDEAIENAQLIAAAVNFLRTHHAELEAMARDAERYRWMREHAGSIRSDCWHWQSHGAAPLENLIDAAIDATQEGEG